MNGIVAVHDAVDRLVSTDLIDKSFQVAEEKGNAVAALQPTDSIRKIEYDRNKALNRDEIVLDTNTADFSNQHSLKKLINSLIEMILQMMLL